MRESKFRGKRIDNGEWVYGGFHKHLKVTPSPTGAGKPRENDYAYLIIESGFSDWEMPRPIEAHEVIPETVGEFTGLHDKNGVEIYEGDVIKSSLGRVAVVEWEKEGRFLGFGADRSISYINREPIVEVIGNIHDNPELLP